MADSDTGEVQWYLPKMRAIIPLDGFHAPRSLRQIVKKNLFEIRINENFEAVMRNCATERGDERGTWISEEMIEVYCELHDMGYAHSVESYQTANLLEGFMASRWAARFSANRCFIAFPMRQKSRSITLLSGSKRTTSLCSIRNLSTTMSRDSVPSKFRIINIFSCLKKL